MSAKLVFTIIKFLLSGKKGRKWLRNLIIGLLLLILVLGAAASGSGLAAMSNVNKALSNIWEVISSLLPSGNNSKEDWLENVEASELLELLEKNGYSVTAGQEKSMRLSPGNFEYLLRKVDNYKKSSQMKRKINVQGLHEYIEIVTTTGKDENGESSSETSVESREEYVYQEIEVSNAEIEGLFQLDWRLLYTYSLLVSIERRGAVEDEGAVEGNAWLIQSSDIDKAYEAVIMKYDYAFDAVRDNANIYYYEECMRLPHILSVNGDPDTESGRYTYYYPRSLLNSGTSGYSTMVHTQEGGLVTGIEELFSHANFEALGKSLCRYYTYQYFTTLLKQIYGGTKLIEAFNWNIKQEESGNAVIRQNAYQINPGAFVIQGDDRYIIEGQLVPGGQITVNGDGSVGTAAVSIALSRLDWRYSQETRYSIGYWDCSSMVSRIYHELGVQIPISSTTVSLLNTAVSKSQTVPFDQLRPGDILFFKTQAGIRSKNPMGVGHVVMYAGGGMIVHAASKKSGTLYQPLASYYNYPGGLLFCARPYINVASSYIPAGTSSTTTLAGQIGVLSDTEVVAQILEIARTDSKKSGILPSVTAAQMILESNYCRSKLSTDANNCFGLKASLSGNNWPNSPWDGISICVMNTKEQDKNGKEYTVSAAFRKYKSVEESVADHSAYLLGAKKGSQLRYSGLTAAKNYREAANIIKNGGYATDKQYVSKLCNLIVRYGLDKYDSHVPKNVTAGGHLIAIDAGHQLNGNSDLEPIAPGSQVLKAKVTSGTTGVSTGVAEYIVNLQIAKLLERELKSRGYRVYMVRESHDVDISNSQRAIMAENAKAELFVRIHCNSVSDSSVKGALTMCQTSKNQWVSGTYEESRALSDHILKGLCSATGAKNKGIQETDEMTGINWCSMPVTIVETGFMSNEAEDKLLNDTEYQIKIAKGIADGIDDFWEGR